MKAAVDASNEKNIKVGQELMETADHLGEDSTNCNLQNFVFCQPKSNNIRYFGATCWVTIIKEAFRKYPIVVRATDKTKLEIRSWLKKAAILNVLPANDISNVLPEYSCMLTILRDFLQNRNNFISQCFSSVDIFRYFEETFNSQGLLRPEFSRISLCIILSVIALSCRINNQFNLEIEVIHATVNEFLQQSEFEITIAQLQALVLAYELKKYDFNNDFMEASVHDISLLPSITVTATALGLNQNIEVIHQGDWSSITALKNLWKYILWNDTIRSFRYGHQPLLDDTFLESHGMDDDTLKERISVIRGACLRINSFSLSKIVNLNEEMDKIQKGLFKQQVTPIYVDYAVIQALSHIRFVKTPNIESMNECFDYSMLLYKESKLKIEEGLTPETHHCKETLFRAYYGILNVLLNLLDSGGSLYRKGEIIDIHWILRFFEQDYQPFLSKMSKLHLGMRLAIMSNINMVGLIKQCLETGKFSDDSTSSFNYEKDEIWEMF